MTRIRLSRDRSRTLSSSLLGIPLLRIDLLNLAFGSILAFALCLSSPAELRAAPILDQTRFDMFNPSVMTLSYDHSSDPADGTMNPVYGSGTVYGPVTFESGVVSTSVFGIPFGDNSQNIGAVGSTIRIQFGVPLFAFGTLIEVDAQSSKLDVTLEIHAFDSASNEILIGDGGSSTLGITLDDTFASSHSGQPFTSGESFIGFRVADPTKRIASLTIEDFGTLVIPGGSLPHIDDTRLALVPEPTSVALLGLGLAALSFLRRRDRQNSKPVAS